MHIKRVHLHNFVSYADLQMPEDLSPGLNLILGQNGSGKSNFLQAIIFVLSDAWAKKTKQERRQFLNNKTDSKEYSVEVILDNSDQRVAVATPQLSIKKTYHIDTDKESYTLNNSHISDKELFNLFEAGGFSLSGASQFQIVQQGQVERLIAQGEEGFLKMLKEVTGTESFDSKVDKMSTVLSEVAGKREQMEKILGKIYERLGELGREIEDKQEKKRA